MRNLRHLLPLHPILWLLFLLKKSKSSALNAKVLDMWQEIAKRRPFAIIVRPGHIISECTRWPPRKTDQATHCPTQNQVVFQAHRLLRMRQVHLIPILWWWLQSKFKTWLMLLSHHLYFYGCIWSVQFSCLIYFYITLFLVHRLRGLQSYDLCGTNITDTKPYTGNEQIIAGNGQQLSISGIGLIALVTPRNQSLSPSNVYFVPHLSANWLSIGQVVDDGYSIHFTSFSCIIHDQRTRKVIGTGSKCGQMFLLDVGLRSLFASSRSLNNLWTIWHRRLGHLNNVVVWNLQWIKICLYFLKTSMCFMLLKQKSCFALFYSLFKSHCFLWYDMLQC